MNTILRTILSGVLGVAAASGFSPLTAKAADLSLAVQPVRSEKETREVYRPLADFIAKVTGTKVIIYTSRDFPEYWVKQKDDNPYDIIIDNAFFTDYRIERAGWVSLAKVPGLVSYSLVTTSDNPAFDPGELIGKRIASLMPPAPPGIFLDQMFSNPLRQPAVMPAVSSEQSLKMLTDGKVDAAIVPTPLVNLAMAGGADLFVVKTSVQIPHTAISVSPKMDEAVRAKLTKAFLEADQNAQGKAVLKSLGITNFEPADASLYSGLMQYLVDLSFAN